MGNNEEGIIELALAKNVLGDIFVEATEMLTKDHMYLCIEKTKQRYLSEFKRFGDLIPILESLKKSLNNENAFSIYSYFYHYLYQQVESLNLFSSPEINNYEKFLENAELIIFEVIENHPKDKEVLNGIYNILKDESVYRIMKSFYLTSSFETEMMKAIISKLTIVNEDEFIKTGYRLVEEVKAEGATFTNEELEGYLQFFTYETNFPSLVSHIKSIEKNGYITYQAYLSHFKKLFFMYVKGIINISGYFKPVKIAPSNSKEFVSDCVSFFESLSTALHPSHIRILYSTLNNFTMELMKACIMQYLVYEPFIPMENVEKSNQFFHMQRKKVYVQLEAQRDDLIKKFDRVFLLNSFEIYGSLYDKFYNKSTEKFDQNIIAYFRNTDRKMEKYSFKNYFKKGLFGAVIGAPIGSVLHMVKEEVARKESRKELSHIVDSQKKFMDSLSSYEEALIKEYELFFDKLMDLVEPYIKNVFYHYQPTRILGLDLFEQHLFSLVELFKNSSVQIKILEEFMPYMNYEEYESKQFKQS